jgi:hypothetical protein
MREKFVFLANTDKMGGDLKELQGAPLKERDRLRKIVSDEFAKHSSWSERSETRALNTLQSDLSATDKPHPALWKYETTHLQSGENWSYVKQRLINYQENGHQRIYVFEFLGSFGGGAYGSKSTGEDLNRGTAQIEGLVNPDEKDESKYVYVKLGTVFLGDARFTELRPQPPNLLNTVYVLGRVVNKGQKLELQADANHTNAHFVWLPNSQTYVRRFVTRGLNHNDVVNIMHASDLGAPVQVVTAQKQELDSKEPERHHVKEGAVLTEQQQILSHTRGWQKRYISTGVSGRPVFSTRGTEFMSIYGTAVIDLAKVDSSTVFDIHSPIAVNNLMHWDASKVVNSKGPGNHSTTLKGEEFLALRDVLRTRELLIKFRVPIGAVNCVWDDDRLAGFGANYFKGPQDLLEGIRKWQGGWPSDQESDVLKYQGYNGKYWLFLLFRDKRDREDFCRSYRRPQGVELLRMKRYVMPASIPGWK